MANKFLYYEHMKEITNIAQACVVKINMYFYRLTLPTRLAWE